jgi:ATP-binding cassette subfamily B protein
MVEGINQLQEGLAALERIGELLRVLPTPADSPEAIEPPLAGRIEFRDVRFAYQGRPVIDGFSFPFERGRSYALVGPSGSGKSTLCQLMLRFWDPDAGEIRIDGHELRAIRQAWYRQNVAVVLQDPVIFSATVRDNIDFAVDGATQAQVERAAREAQAHDFIMALPQGYDTRLGERGVSLSGGQRQRIAIARALMRDPKLLILDEATSALDTVTEREIQAVIDRLHGSRTVVVIAHRLSTVRNVDEILVLDRGRLVEHGAWDSLIASGGVFARLAAEQESGRH